MGIKSKPSSTIYDLGAVPLQRGSAAMIARCRTDHSSLSFHNSRTWRVR